MEKLDNLITKLEGVRDTLIETIADTIKMNEGTILELNFGDQLYDEGMDRNGVPLRPPYAPRTIRYKRKKGQPTNRVTLRDTGRFHESFYIEYRPDSFLINAKDAVTPHLKERYGPAILGLADQSVEYVIDELITPALQENIKSIWK